MMRIAPSILAADTLRLGEEIRLVMDAGCDYLHIDVMDGHFVPNMSFGPDTVRAIHRQFPQLRLDVHLMQDNPSRFVDIFADAGAWGITIHAEIPEDTASILQRIRALGCSAGLALKPATPARAVSHLMRDADMLLVMTVEPGFGGQALNPAMPEKLLTLRQMGWHGLIEADGGLTMSNLPLMAACGLDIAVMGTAVFRADNPAEQIRRMQAVKKEAGVGDPSKLDPN